MTLKGQQNSTVTFAILRMELDSLIRVFFLLTLPAGDRVSFFEQTLSGQERWRMNGRVITDRQMLENGASMVGWERYIYRFGCAFIHLSTFHDPTDSAVSTFLCEEECQLIRGYVREYHGAELSEEIRLSELFEVAEDIFMKVRDNMLSYLPQLENQLDMEDFSSSF